MSMSVEPKTCPNCSADLNGSPIPDEYIKEGCYGDATHFSRVIGIYSIEEDRTVAWRCPDCEHEWERK
jgi:hypothetical protein